MVLSIKEIFTTLKPFFKDGTIDCIQYYDDQRNLSRVKADTKFDGKIDHRDFLAKEKTY
jgi:hypothetical protein